MHRGLLIAAFCTLFVAENAQAEEPAASPPSMKMTVTPAATGLWSLKIQNTGESPVRIAADPRLISLEITHPGATTEVDKKTKAQVPFGGASPTCTLPADARPSTDEGQELVIPASRSWSTTFDPLFMCFGPRERAALVAGASVKARFGWKPPPPPKGKAKAALPSPPFAVSPVGASVGKVVPLKELESDPVTLSDTISTKPAPTTPDADAPKIYLMLPETMDAAKGVDLSTTITLANDSDRPVTLLFRPDLVQFSVSGPSGSVGCGSTRSVGSPMRELFVTVGSKARTSLSVLFTATCPSGTFDAPGLYRISATLDTTQASGRSINMKTWDDVAKSKQPLLLRVREPHRAPAAGRPSLD